MYTLITYSIYSSNILLLQGVNKQNTYGVQTYTFLLCQQLFDNEVVPRTSKPRRTIKPSYLLTTNLTARAFITIQPFIL